MCRFMALKSDTPVAPGSFLRSFARMSRDSLSYDGDWQGDGCGVGWLSDDGSRSEWKSLKSTAPIWEAPEMPAQVPESRLVMAHARSASFPRHKGVLDYSQPFFKAGFAFVFNGLIKGVSLPYEVEGRIGSQKIWSLLFSLLRHEPPRPALYHLRELMDRHARDIQAMNIGLCDKKRLYIYSHFTRHPGYYRLYSHCSPGLTVVSSEPLDGLEFSPLDTGSVMSF